MAGGRPKRAVPQLRRRCCTREGHVNLVSQAKDLPAAFSCRRMRNECGPYAPCNCGLQKVEREPLFAALFNFYSRRAGKSEGPRRQDKHGWRAADNSGYASLCPMSRAYLRTGHCAEQIAALYSSVFSASRPCTVPQFHPNVALAFP